MDYIIGLAGIPKKVFSDVKDEITMSAGQNCIFIARPSDQERYFQSDTNYFINEFAKYLEKDHHNNLSDTGFALLFINYDEETSEKFRESFFPFLLCAEIDWKLDASSNKKIQESKNNLVKLLRARINDAKKSIIELKKELSERANKTPLLLPIKNFNSDVLKQAIQYLHNNISHVQDKNKAIRDTVTQIAIAHPPRRLDGMSKDCFLDRKDIEYHAPGKSLHGKIITHAGHPKKCLLSGRRRLGTPFSPGFHYDCKKGSRNLKGDFWECHSETKLRKEGKPHLNIAPNDNIR